MGILNSGRLLIIIGALITVSRSQTVKCGTTTEGGNGNSREPCTDPKPHDYIENEEEDGLFKGSTTYLFIVVIGVIALPATLVLRLCWARRMQQERMSAVDAARHLRTHDHLGNRGDIFSIDIGEFEYPVIPTYEQSLTLPTSDNPPPYAELPPCYADIGKLKLHKLHGPQPSTSSDCSHCTLQVHDGTGTQTEVCRGEECHQHRPKHGQLQSDTRTRTDVVEQSEQNTTVPVEETDTRTRTDVVEQSEQNTTVPVEETDTIQVNMTLAVEEMETIPVVEVEVMVSEQTDTVLGLSITTYTTTSETTAEVIARRNDAMTQTQ